MNCKIYYLLSILFLTSIVCCSLSCTVFASSSNWVEVARYDGSVFPGVEEFDTEGFDADHEEWRIRWGYDAVGSSIESMLMIAKGSDMIVISSGYSDKTGIKTLHGQQENFSLYVTCINLNSYTIIIEKDVNSIPEFPTWMTMPILIAITVTGILIKRRADKK